jgi:hypothetical protein
MFISVSKKRFHEEKALAKILAVLFPRNSTHINQDGLLVLVHSGKGDNSS